MFLEDDIIEKIFELAQIKNSNTETTQADVMKALVEIERKLNFFANTSFVQNQNKFNIMVVDDLELSIFQFTQLLKKMGSSPNVARSKEEAMAEIRKKEFDYIVVDLYLPDLNDGLSLITEMMKYKENYNQHFKLIAISSTDDEKIIKNLYTMGVDEFIAKNQNWHEEILKYIANNMIVENDNYSVFVCENDISVYEIKHIHNTSDKNSLLEHIAASIYSQKPNIILNVERMKSFDENFTSLFSEIYKMCSEANGGLVILSPSCEITDALKNAFLDGVIKTAANINEAIKIIKNK